YDGEHIEVIPLGVTLPRNGALRKAHVTTPIRFGFIGTVLPLKGAEILLQAFATTPRSNIRLTFYGREDIVPAFSRKLRRDAARDGRIAFAGPFQPADRDLVYQDIDVLVIPSTAHESFSLVAREALGRGIPVIASEIGALPEVIKDGVNGFLTPPGDPQALGAVIARLADHPELLSDLQMPGPISILSTEQHFERLLAIYDECRALPS
ncbi:MAG: glycosyltransferase, partial [Nitrososphaerales archaeon]